MRYSRRTFLQAAGMGASLLFSHGCYSTRKKRTAHEKPNIVYILADDLGWGDLSCYGQKKFSTPNIDRLAAEGMKFTDHYAGSTVCAPSRCTLMTGLHTGHCQIRGNKEVKPEGQWPLAAGTETLPRMLKRCGYTTGAFGKWGLGAPGSEGDPTNQGFDYFFGYNCQREAHKYYRSHLWRNREKVQLPENDPEKQVGRYCHDLIANECLSFIERNRYAPFFLYAPFTIPHAELVVPEDSMRMFNGAFPEKPYKPRNEKGYGTQLQPHAAFAAMITRLDRDVGRILDMLKALDLDENTIVMFSSDNGPHKEGGADPDFFDSNGPFKGYKRDLYEGGIRVPMLARWPGRVPAGTTTDHVSAFWDLMPTCADLAGIKAETKTDGISFLPTLLGDQARQKHHDHLYWEFHERGGKQAVRMGRWKAVRQKVKRPPESPIELYDLSTDPGETNNIAAAQPDVVKHMAELMKTSHGPNEVFALFPGKG